MTARQRGAARAAAASLAMAAFLGGCSSNGTDSNYSQFYKLAGQSLAASFGNVRVTREQAAAIPYASMGIRIDGGNQALVVLATDTGGELLWTSAAHIVVVTRDGRIVRTVGLDHDVAAVTSRDNNGLLPPALALKGPFSSIRLADFPDIGHYGAQLSCRATARGRQTITILGQAIATMRVDETCQSRELNWSFTDIFWVDADNGLVWRSQQHIHPKGGVIETEVLRPPG